MPTVVSGRYHLHGEVLTSQYDVMSINFFKFTHKVCEHFMSTQQVGRPPKVIYPAKEGHANKLLKYIDTISPLPLNALGDTNHCFVDNLSVLQHLKCPLCLEVLNQPLKLSCKALVCAKCIKQWIAVSVDVQCPCLL